MEGEIPDMKKQLADLAPRASAGGEGGGGGDGAGDGNELPASAEEVKNKDFSEAKKRIPKLLLAKGLARGRLPSCFSQGWRRQRQEEEEEEEEEEETRRKRRKRREEEEDGAASEMRREEVKIARERERERERRERGGRD